MIEFACPQCGNKIRTSDDSAGKRGTCKQCGSQIQVPQVVLQAVLPVAHSPPRRVQTIQATAKKWKLLQLLGALGMIASVSYGAAKVSTGANAVVAGEAIAIGILGFITSLAIYLFGRIAAWWFHG